MSMFLFLLALCYSFNSTDIIYTNIYVSKSLRPCPLYHIGPFLAHKTTSTCIGKDGTSPWKMTTDYIKCSNSDQTIPRYFMQVIFELKFHDMPNMLYGIKMREVRQSGHQSECIHMIIEPQQHNFSLATWRLFAMWKTDTM